MIAAGLDCVTPIGELSVNGFTAVLAALPRLTRLVYRTVDSCVAFDPDLLIIVDSPDFNHPVAKRVKKRMPDLPVVNYVSPTVWAWRPGRARRMAKFVDLVLGIFSLRASRA